MSQVAAGQYAVHQFKDYVGANTSCSLNAQLQVEEAPALSTVTLQIYNRNTSTWNTVATNNSAAANTDFDMVIYIPDLTNYKDASNVISSRIWQLGV